MYFDRIVIQTLVKHGLWVMTVHVDILMVNAFIRDMRQTKEYIFTYFTYK